jgi:protein-disulfide isomerase
VTDSLIDQILAEVPGLDAAKVKVDAKSAKVANQIAAVQSEATKLGVQGTPWFYLAVGFNPPVNFQPGSLTPSEFRTPIDQALKAGSP